MTYCCELLDDDVDASEKQCAAVGRGTCAQRPCELRQAIFVRMTGPWPQFAIAEKRQSPQVLMAPGVSNIGHEVIETEHQCVGKRIHGAMQHFATSAIGGAT